MCTCDMTRSCGGVTGGWVRVGYLDMTNSSHQCPSGFMEHTDSNICACRRTGTSAGCGSVMMDVPYSRVCGISIKCTTDHKTGHHLPA